jgi:hypothetical protein
MGTNTPNPSGLSLEDATHALEDALSNLDSLAALARAVGGSAMTVEPQALYPIADALHRTYREANAAWEVVFPVLCAAREDAAKG